MGYKNKELHSFYFNRHYALFKRIEDTAILLVESTQTNTWRMLRSGDIVFYSIDGRLGFSLAILSVGAAKHLNLYLRTNN